MKSNSFRDRATSSPSIKKKNNKPETRKDKDQWNEYYVPKVFKHYFSSVNVNPHSTPVLPLEMK